MAFAMGYRFASTALLTLTGCVSFPRMTSPPIAPPPGGEFLRGHGNVRLYTSTEGPGTRGVVWFVLGPETPARPPYERLTAALHETGFATAVAHARGTGFSDGLRGDIDDYALVLSDYRLFLEHFAGRFPNVFLFGQSAGAALALALAASPSTPLAGVVVVNPAWKLTYGKGMGPTFRDYVVYAANAVFRRSALTVDMNRSPSAVQFAPDREEAEAMQRDPLVVRYFSLRYLFGQRKVMKRCKKNAAAVRVPLLLVQGAHDGLVDPDSFDELLAAVEVSDKHKLVAPEGGHGSSAVETMVLPLVEWLTAHADP
jgi:alpha-beta hydrolase superfamily lysophospholipase